MSDKYDRMSDMAIDRITVRIPLSVGEKLRARARAKGRPEAELVREALESYFGRTNGDGSAYDLAKEAGLIGGILRAPRDLSTNARHLQGFGKRK